MYLKLLNAPIFLDIIYTKSLSKGVEAAGNYDISALFPLFLSVSPYPSPPFP